MLDHDISLAYIGRAKMDNIISTNYVSQLVEMSKNGKFIGKACVALNNLKKKDYTGKEKELVSDAAYAMTGQILRVNGEIPEDIATGNKLTAEQFYNSLNTNPVFKNNLPVDPNDKKTILPKEIYKMATNDAKRKAEVKKQEKDAKKAARDRKNEAYQKKQNNANNELQKGNKK